MLLLLLLHKYYLTRTFVLYVYDMHLIWQEEVGGKKYSRSFARFVIVVHKFGVRCFKAQESNFWTRPQYKKKSIYLAINNKK